MLAHASGHGDLECNICYCAYNLGSRRPKVLECCHRLCAKCLAKIQDLGESPPRTAVCPFCRHVSRPPGLPDDRDLLAALANLRFHREQLRRLSSPMASEATPSSIRGSPNFVVITITEPPPPTGHDQPGGAPVSVRGLRSASGQDSMASVTQRRSLWNCAALLCQTSARALVWVLGLLYFSSLPTGVYLLIMQQTTAGVLLVSLVPASLVVVMVYGLCRCVCQEVWKCTPPERDHL